MPKRTFAAEHNEAFVLQNRQTHVMCNVRRRSKCSTICIENVRNDQSACKSKKSQTVSKQSLLQNVPSGIPSREFSLRTCSAHTMQTNTSHLEHFASGESPLSITFSQPEQVVGGLDASSSSACKRARRWSCIGTTNLVGTSTSTG